MLVYAAGSVSILFFNAVLWYLILSRKKRSPLIAAYLKWSGCVAAWSFGYAITLSGLFSYETTLFWNRLCHAFAVFIAATFLELALALIKSQSKKEKTVLALIYGMGVVLLALDITPLFVQGLWPMTVFKYQPLGGPAYVYFVLYFGTVVSYGLYILFRKFKRAVGNEREQLKVFLLGSTIGYLGGANLFFQAFKISVNPVGVFFISSYVVFTGYAIYRYGFMNLELIVKRTMVFAGLFTTIFAVFSATSFLTREIFKIYFGLNEWIAFALTIGITIVIYEPLKKFLTNATDKVLFQKKYNPLELIKAFSKDVLTELDLNQIAHSTIEQLSKVMRVRSSALLIPNKDGDQFIVADSDGSVSQATVLPKESSLAKRLGETDCVLPGAETSLDDPVLNDLGLFKAIIALAIKRHGALIGILTVGEKQSDEDYNTDDIEILRILSDALGVAVTNALAFEEARQKEKLVAVGTLAAGIKHDISTPINLMSMTIQSFLIDREEGRHKKLPPQEILSEAYSHLMRCRTTFDKVVAISAKFADVARPKTKVEWALIDVPELIETYLSVLDNEMETKGIRLLKEISNDLPKIVCDQDYMQQILFNILRNAIHAIQEANRPKEEAILIIRAYRKDTSACIEIEDSGTGIAPDNLNKIFEAYYTTKPEGVGTGLGLAIVKELVKRCNGTISVKSALGKGTTFTLEFKVTPAP